MALIKNIATRCGGSVEYWKLDGYPNFDHSQKMVTLRFKVYTSREDYLDPAIVNKEFIIKLYGVRNSGNAMFYNDYFSPEALSPEGISPQKQAYLYIKTLPELAGAIDVDV